MTEIGHIRNAKAIFHTVGMTRHGMECDAPVSGRAITHSRPYIMTGEVAEQAGKTLLRTQGDS